MATDFLQSMVMLSMAIMLAALCLIEVGGVGGFFSMLRETGVFEDFRVIKSSDTYPDGKYTFAWATAVTIYPIIVLASLEDSPRFFAVKDGASVRQAARSAVCKSNLRQLGIATRSTPTTSARRRPATCLTGSSTATGLGFGRPGMPPRSTTTSSRGRDTFATACPTTTPRCLKTPPPPRPRNWKP